MRRRFKQFKRFWVYVVVRTVVFGCSLFPSAWVFAFGRFMGRLIELLARRARPRALTNTQRALQLSAEESQVLVHDMFSHFGCLAAEIAVMPRLLSEPARIRWSDGSQRVIKEALAEQRGAVFVSAHLGNWELLAHAVALAGFPCTTVARRSTNPRVGTWLEARRKASGLATIRRRDPRAVRQILRALRSNQLVGVLIDQHTRVDSVAVPFFGQLAATPTIAASLALRGTPLLLGIITRAADSCHEITIERVEFTPDSGTRREHIAALTAQLSRRIEAVVATHPEQWTWFHDRWPTRVD